jgi:hypothetical protein
MSARQVPTPLTLPSRPFSHTLQERDLDEAFRRFGRIKNIWIARKPGGFAFVVSPRRRLYILI